MSFTNYSAGSYVTAAGSASTTLATLVSVSPFESAQRFR